MSTCRYCNGSKMAKTEAGYRPCPFCNGTGVSSDSGGADKQPTWWDKNWGVAIVVIIIFIIALTRK